MTTPTPYQKQSRIANIYQHTIDLENYANAWLEDEPKLFEQIKRNTTSIKSIINKFLTANKL